MNAKLRDPLARLCPHTAVAIVALALSLVPGTGQGQITSELANQIRAGIEDRIEALSILGGDFGLASGVFRTRNQIQTGQGSTDVQSDVTKGGGGGEVGDPRPLGDLDIGWQPRLQGNMGHLESTSRPLGVLAGDSSEVTTDAIEFGGGARFWLSDRFSLAPTLMGLYGHTSNNYTARSVFMRTNLAPATELGLVDWSIDTWTLRPALNLQYVISWGRSLITLSSDSTYFHTEGFNSSNSNVKINGDSGSLANKIDVDIPLGIELCGHELRFGGYVSRTELSGDLRNGLGVQEMNEIHGRLVLDFLNQLWKVQWIGVGASHVWGTNITGWTADADIAFRF
ncbi:MAG: hypothetical protein ACLP1Q_14135 [Solirubrobacteraceae bacterium]